MSSRSLVRPDLVPVHVSKPTHTNRSIAAMIGAASVTQTTVFPQPVRTSRPRQPPRTQTVWRARSAPAAALHRSATTSTRCRGLVHRTLRVTRAAAPTAPSPAPKHDEARSVGSNPDEPVTDAARLSALRAEERHHVDRRRGRTAASSGACMNQKWSVRRVTSSPDHAQQDQLDRFLSRARRSAESRPAFAERLFVQPLTRANPQKLLLEQHRGGPPRCASRSSNWRSTAARDTSAQLQPLGRLHDRSDQRPDMCDAWPCARVHGCR